MGAYSRWALIRGWALIRINTGICIYRNYGAGSRDISGFQNCQNVFTSLPLPSQSFQLIGSCSCCSEIWCGYREVSAHDG